MTVTVTDKRGQGTRKAETPPPWWPVLVAIEGERKRQLDKWGVQHHPDGTGASWFTGMAEHYKGVNDSRAVKGTPQWALILLEEVFEALSETDPDRLMVELVQVAAVATGWCEDIASRDRGQS